MRFGVVTLFPEWIASVGEDGVIGRALKRGLIELEALNPRDFTTDKHRTVDDRPYGGGPGMVMMPEPMDATLTAMRARMPTAPIIYMSPQGERLTQTIVHELAEMPEVILIAGRYEGLDERVIDKWVDRELSIGDFVVSGGELPAMIVIDAVSRWLPGVLGHADSAAQDSFADGLLDCPHYTRPECFEGRSVPSVLLSGDHQKIRQWREEQARLRTAQRRPDLL
jgi:tRNA (guanine37-N1)-methyltransferase